ncbi:MAG TPA: hypothetical protein ENH29_11155 [Bacteroidetes bacterium]|nr:hypothetical protein [Bacteroidota bacterium]
MFKRVGIAEKLICGSFLILSLLLNRAPLAAQDSTGSQIRIATSVNQTKVPLNRNLQLRVVVSWVGNSDRFDVLNFDNPALTNFEIIGTATTSRTEIDTVYKEYDYTLKPNQLGMAYVEGVVVKAYDKVLAKDESLVTQRIPVEVIEAVPEPGETDLTWLFVVLTIFVISIFVWFIIRQQKKRKKAHTVAVEQAIPLETRFLEDLRGQFSLDHPDLHEDFSRLSKLLRRYLTEKFKIRGMEATTNELPQLLAGTALEPNRIESVREILIRSDEIRFSGMEGSKEEMSRFYTLFEGILESFLRKPETEQNESGKE